jgi:hypothetical protein
MMTEREIAAEAANVAARMDAAYEALRARGWNSQGASEAAVALAEGGFFNQQKFQS